MEGPACERFHVNRRHNLLTTALRLTLLLLLLGGIAAVEVSAEDFAPVQERLIADGFPRDVVLRTYQQGKAVLQVKTVAAMFRLQESRLNYDQFLEADAIARAKAFLVQHQPDLSGAEAAYGVDRAVIAAILLVETRFGVYTGRTPTLAILSTYALMDQGQYRDRIWAELSVIDQQRWERGAFDEKLQRRAKWAYEELCALLRWADGDPSKLADLRGSLMGAIGIPQFIPSSVERYAVDGNRDGEVDLQQFSDAIWSVANYLKSFGWCDAGTLEEQAKVIYHYNHSSYYVNAVLGVAQQLQPS